MHPSCAIWKTLTIYQRPHNPDIPVICMDEIKLIAEKTVVEYAKTHPIEKKKNGKEGNDQL